MDSRPKAWLNALFTRCIPLKPTALSLCYAMASMIAFIAWTYQFYVQENPQMILLLVASGGAILAYLSYRKLLIKPFIPLSILASSIILLLLIDQHLTAALINLTPLLIHGFLYTSLLLLITILWRKNQQQNQILKQDKTTKLNLAKIEIPPTTLPSPPAPSDKTTTEETIELLKANNQQQQEQLQKLNEELTQSYQDLELFAYVASHDLQEPLRMVGNFVQLLAREYKNKIDQQGIEYIHYAVDGVNRMSKLINALLQFSRVGRRNIKLKTANPEALLRNALIQLQSQQKSKEVVFQLTAFPQKMICEAQQVGIIFLQLLSNAIKFNQNDPIIINVTAEERATDFYFMVEDNGIGINLPQQKERQIFEIFKKLHRKELYEGTGIGLSLCHKIVKRHGGEIWYESNKEGGTRFYFTISKQIPHFNEAEAQTIDASLFFQN